MPISDLEDEYVVNGVTRVHSCSRIELYKFTNIAELNSNYCLKISLVDDLFSLDIMNRSTLAITVDSSVELQRLEENNKK